MRCSTRIASVVFLFGLLAAAAACAQPGARQRSASPRPPTLVQTVRDLTVSPTAVKPQAADTVVPPYSFADAWRRAEFWLVRGALPGTAIGEIESLAYVKTTVRAALGLLGTELRRREPPGNPWRPDAVAWLFVEYGQIFSDSIHGGSRGAEGTQWVLVPNGFDATQGFAAGTIPLSTIGTPTVIRPGDMPAIDRVRARNATPVRTTADAIRAVARFLPDIDGGITSIRYVETTADRAATITGVSAAGLPATTRAWLFDAEGTFQLICGGTFHDPTSAIRMLLVEGRVAPYLIVPNVPGLPATPVAPLAAIGRPIALEPGAWPAIDQFRLTAAEAAGTAAAISRTEVVPCGSSSEPPRP